MVDVKLANWLSLRPIWSSRRLADGVGFSLELVEVCVVGREKAQASGGGACWHRLVVGPAREKGESGGWVEGCWKRRRR